MNKNIIIAVALALLIGGATGYLIAPKDEGVSTTMSSSEMSGEVDGQKSMDTMIADMKDKKGEALDQAFLDGMIAHHEGAIAMANIVLKETKRPELKKMAQDIINAQSVEIITMKGWLNQWYGR